MTTQKQIEANRKNAMLGGVKTEVGKAVSKYNAMKHGLLSKEVLLDDENEQVLHNLEQKLRLQLAPEGELELVLVDRITANVWRLKRVMQIEREMIDVDRTSMNMDGKFRKKTLGESLAYGRSQNDIYNKLIRYETNIERGIYKALHELQRIQSVRMGEKTQVPIAVDIDVSKD